MDRQTYESVQLDPDIPLFMWLHTRGQTKNPRVVNCHWHRSVEFNIIWKDELLYYVNGREHRLSEGTVCLINSMDVHCARPLSQVSSPEIIGFTLIIGYDFLKSLIADLEDSVFELDTQEKTRAVYTLLRDISHIFSRREELPYWKVQVMEKACSLIYYLCRNCKSARSMASEPAMVQMESVRRVIEYIQNHYMQDIKQQDISEEFFYSREYLSRLFKKYTNCTIKDYLTQYRLLQSEKQLRVTNRTVAEIAAASGFNDARQFIRAFKKYYGITPLQFRRKEQGTILRY